MRNGDSDASWFEGAVDAVAPGYTRGLIINACLANGRGDAAVFLAQRGARLDLEGACGGLPYSQAQLKPDRSWLSASRR